MRVNNWYFQFFFVSITIYNYIFMFFPLQFIYHQFATNKTFFSWKTAKKTCWFKQKYKFKSKTYSYLSDCHFLCIFIIPNHCIVAKKISKRLVFVFFILYCLLWFRLLPLGPDRLASPKPPKLFDCTTFV